MKEYMGLIVTHYLDEVDTYLKDGWEIIETAKYEEGSETRIDYHLGLPARAFADQLLEVIRTYEKHGLKEKLMEAVAESDGDDVSHYQIGKGSYIQSKTAQFMTEYEWRVNQKIVEVRSTKPTPPPKSRKLIVDRTLDPQPDNVKGK